MKRIFLLGAVLLSCHLLGAQQAATTSLDAVKFLAGKWVGEGSGEAAQAGSGYCTFEPDVQGKVLVRRNHAEYPATNDHPAIAHDDIMVIYPDASLHQLRAFYTDNEGHVIHYTVTAAPDGKSAVFLGDSDPTQPRYRLTYNVTQPEHMTITFEMAIPSDPEQFHTIIDGKLKRTGN